MRVLGNRVYLKLPKRPETKVILDDEAQKAEDEKFSKKLDRLEVKFVGELVEHIKVGNFVCVDPRRVQGVGLHQEIAGDSYLIISQHEIMHIW